MSNQIQATLREFILNILRQLNAPETIIDDYKRFINGQVVDQNHGENQNLHIINLSLNSTQTISLEITDDITPEENFISFDISSIEEGAILYLLVNVDEPMSEQQAASASQEDFQSIPTPQYYYHLVDANHASQEGFLTSVDDSKKYLAAIIQALEIEILIEE